MPSAAMLPMAGLVGGLAAWWLLVAAVLFFALPAPTSSELREAPHRLIGQQQARVHLPAMRDLPVPTSRLAFDEFQRGVRESDEAAIDAAFEMAEWVAVNHGDDVHVVAFDGETVEIELLEGSYTGRHAWVLRRQLTQAD
jgi:hypothetical protein